MYLVFVVCVCVTVCIHMYVCTNAHVYLLACVRPFVSFIKGILDYLEDLDDFQLRVAFSVFSALAVAEHDQTSGESSLDDTTLGTVFVTFNRRDLRVFAGNDLNILIRKQLSSVDVNYQRIGIVQFRWL